MRDVMTLLTGWTRSARRNYAVNAPIAQLVEQQTFNLWVVRSSRTGGTAYPQVAG